MGEREGCLVVILMVILRGRLFRKAVMIKLVHLLTNMVVYGNTKGVIVVKSLGGSWSMVIGLSVWWMVGWLRVVSRGGAIDMLCRETPRVVVVIMVVGSNNGVVDTKGLGSDVP